MRHVEVDRRPGGARAQKGTGRFLAAAILAAAATVLAGCGGTERSDPPRRPTSSVESSAGVSSSTAPTTTTPTTTPPSSGATTSAPATGAPSTTGATTTSWVPQRAGGQGSGSLAGRVIVVDPGHNGGNGSHTREINRTVDAGGFQKACNTTGTAGGSYAESTFTWDTSQLLAAELRRRGATVILTREDNTGWGPCIDQRGLTAQRNHADLLLSIHADGAGAGAHGFHVISPSTVRGFTDSTSAPSAVLAASVRDALVAAGLTPATYVGRAGLIQRGDLGTLNRAGVPAVMLESGNMRNAADLAMLRSADGQATIARAMADGAGRFLAGR